MGSFFWCMFAEATVLPFLSFSFLFTVVCLCADVRQSPTTTVYFKSKPLIKAIFVCEINKTKNGCLHRSHKNIANDFLYLCSNINQRLKKKFIAMKNKQIIFIIWWRNGSCVIKKKTRFPSSERPWLHSNECIGDARVTRVHGACAVCVCVCEHGTCAHRFNWIASSREKSTDLIPCFFFSRFCFIFNVPMLLPPSLSLFL